jgi:DTW domain-containing protein YfiP
VRLPQGPPSTLRLRANPDPDRISTFEAIVRALGILEGAEVQAALEHVLALKIERTRWTRKPPSREEIERSEFRPRPRAT